VVHDSRDEHATPPVRADYWTIFLVSAAILLYQIALTRVLSVVVWYHFAFLTISLVMLGLGAPGVWFSFVRRPLRMLPGFLLASAITVPLSVALIVHYGALLLDQSIGYIALCVIPATLSLGGSVCLLLMKASGPAVARMYGTDLLGASLGAALVIPLMHQVSTPQLAAACGLLPLAGLALQGRSLAPLSLALALVLLAVSIHGEAYRITRSKSYDESVVAPIYEKWSPTARIAVFDERFFVVANQPMGFNWGRGAKFPRQAATQIRQYWLEQDGSAGTPITAFDGDLSGLEHLFYDVTTLGYQLRPPRDVAIIGTGGGRDILSALFSGATSVHAVELNPHIIDAVSERFGEFSGDVYHRPGVTAVADEGRSFMTRVDERFDLVQISLTDSWAASAAGAFALAENNLYTVEAFQLYLERLGEDGILSTSRWTRELPRLILLAHASLRELGVAEPLRHLAIASASEVATLLISRTPLEPEDLERLDAICQQRGFERVYPPRPGASGKNALYAAIVERAERGDLAPVRAQGIDTRPPTDDRPYFFQSVSPLSNLSLLKQDPVAMTRGLYFNAASTIVLWHAALMVSLLALLLFLVPFARGFRRAGPGEAREPWGNLVRSSLYFAAIGAGFMLLENLLVQRFVLYLGHPSYAVIVILACLLVGMGAGSIASPAFGLHRWQRFGICLPLALVALMVALPSLFAATLGWPLAARVILGCALLAPLGAALGLFFPLGMLRFGDRHKPWYWAVNGIFGVVASVMSLLLAMNWGFTAVGIVSAVAYLLAWWLLRDARRGPAC
jgi:hypothetical protein